MPDVRLPDGTYQLIQEMAQGRPMHIVIAEAIEELRRKRIFEQANRAYAALRQDPHAEAEEEAERHELEGTLSDGLDESY